MVLKEYFQEPSITRLKERKFRKYVYKDFVREIIDSNENELLVLNPELTPLVPGGTANLKNFMRKGPEVKLHRYKTLEDVIKDSKLPEQLRFEAFEGAMRRPPFFCGYSFMPVIGKDKRKRKVSLAECFRGAQLYTYSRPYINLDKDVKPDVKVYADAKRVAIEGGKIYVRIPSRTKKRERYKIRFNSVPVVDNSYKYALQFNLSTTHDCGSKMFNIRSTPLESKESSDVFNFCAHEIAAYLFVIEYYLKKKKNRVPLDMCPFVIPSLQGANYSRNMNNNCLVSNSENRQLRKLNIGDKEILFWRLNQEKGYNFGFSPSARVKLKNYRWR